MAYQRTWSCRASWYRIWRRNQTFWVGATCFRNEVHTIIIRASIFTNYCDKSCHILHQNIWFPPHNPNPNRRKKIDGVTKSEVVGYNDTGQRQRYLSFGDPPSGANGGNTAYNTHRVLQIVEKAIVTKINHGDGGWKAALRVCVNLNRLAVHVIVFVSCSHTLNTSFVVLAHKKIWLASIS